MEPNFWKDKPKAEKILKEKKLYDDLVNSYKVSLKKFNEISDLYDLALEENNQSVLKESENNIKKFRHFWSCLINFVFNPLYCNSVTIFCPILVDRS